MVLPILCGKHFEGVKHGQMPKASTSTLLKNTSSVPEIHMENIIFKKLIDRIRAIIRIRPLITDTQTNILDW